MIFTAHCIARGPPCAITGLPESTSGVEFTTANEPLRTFAPEPLLLKLPRFTRLRMLKISHRASILAPPDRWNDLRMLMSHWASPGCRAEFRPHVPIVPGAGVPNACAAFVMNGSDVVELAGYR